MAHPLGPLTEFETDGCSGGLSWAWKKLFDEKTPWEGCCETHDVSYHKGGGKEERLVAYQALRQCVRGHGYLIWAFCMYYAVRLGGGPRFPTKYRWGYGYKYSFGGGYNRFAQDR